MENDRFERISNDFEPPHNDEKYFIVDGTKVEPGYIKSVLDI